MRSDQVALAVAGSFGFADIGDEAMLTEDLAFIRHDLGVANERIALFGHDPDYVATYHVHPRAMCLSSDEIVHDYQRSDIRPTSWVKRARGVARECLFPFRRNPPGAAVRRLARQCNAALITGGGTINTRDEQGWSLHRMHAVVSYFRHRGLRVFMSGQTIGPLGIVPRHDQLAREIVAAVDVLTVRDDGYSRHYLEKIGAQPRQFLETFDDAYTLSASRTPLPADVEAFLTRHPTVAVNVTEYTGNLPEQRAFMARFVTRVIQEAEFQVVLVSHAPRDYENLRLICDQLPAPIQARVLVPDTRAWRDTVLKQLISRCRVAVGGRYHFIVFAGTSDTPFVGMCGNHYSYIKQHGFARPLGLGDFILTEEQTWNGDTLWERFMQARQLTLQLRTRFARPSASMQLFRSWLESLSRGARCVPRLPALPPSARG